MPKTPRRRLQPSARAAQPAKKKPDYTPQRNDPVASLRVWGADVMIGPVLAHIPPHPAVEWLKALFDGDVSDLFDERSKVELDELALNGELPEETPKIFLETVSEVSGRPWYVALRLCDLLNDDTVRALTFAKIDVATSPLALVLDVIYATVTQYMDDKDRKRFEDSLAAEVNAMTSDPREAARRAREFARERAQAIGKPSAAIPPTVPRSLRKPHQDDRSKQPTKQP